MRLASTVLVGLLVVVAFAGCVELSDSEGKRSAGSRLVQSAQVVDPERRPIANAQVAVSGNGQVLLLYHADEQGNFRLAGLPPGSTDVAVGAAGYQARSFSIGQVPPIIVLEPAGANGTLPGVPIFAFRKPVDLLCADTPRCGEFGEPVVEVAGDGTIWASATCCIGFSPPIWISKDGGATFKMLRGQGTGLIRDVTGIEGDFAIDDAGNVYFFDILAATSWFTTYSADGTHQWTGAWPYPPLVDRPWVRAGKANQAFVIYNTGSSTNFYESLDGGKTWTAQPGFTAPCALGTPGQGPTRERMFIAACASAPKVWITKDAGKTWSVPYNVPLPEWPAGVARGIDVFMPPVSDEAGNIYVPFTHNLNGNNNERAIFVARMNVDLTWSGPWQVSPGGMNEKPWPAASREGQLAIAWYHTETKRENQTRADWYLMAAASVDAHTETPHFQTVVADPQKVLTGAFGRALGDFLEADFTPDGRLVVVYAKRADGLLTNRFVSSDGGLDLSPLNFLNGPRPK